MDHHRQCIFRSTGWEAADPDLCTRARDEGQFFGFVRGAKGFLGRYTQLLDIPAVRDAARDAEEGRGSVLTTLMDLVVRNAIAGRPALLRLKRRSQLLYELAMNPAKIPELVALGNELTGTLRTLVPDASVDLQWKPLDTIALPLPTADIKLVEDGYPSAVERTGHGLQRAFIITMLQHLAMAQVSGGRARRRSIGRQAQSDSGDRGTRTRSAPQSATSFCTDARSPRQRCCQSCPAERTQVIYGTPFSPVRQYRSDSPAQAPQASGGCHPVTHEGHKSHPDQSYRGRGHALVCRRSAHPESTRSSPPRLPT